MSLQVDCSCGQRFLAQPHLQGRRVRCPVCQRWLQVPTTAPQQQPPPAAPLVAACQCGQRFHAEPKLAGSVIPCPSCKRPIQVPRTPPQPSLRSLDAGLIESSVRATPYAPRAAGSAPPQEDWDNGLVLKVLAGGGAALGLLLLLFLAFEFGPRLARPRSTEGEPLQPLADTPPVVANANEPGANSSGSTETDMVPRPVFFTSSEGRFSAVFPFPPQPDQGETTVAGGQAVFHGARSSGPGGAIYQVVSYQIDALPTIEEQNQLLDQYCDRVAQTKKTTTRYELFLAGRIGRYLEYADQIGPQPVMVKTQVYQLVDRQIHASVIESATAKSQAAAIRNFFNSLQFESAAP